LLQSIALHPINLLNTAILMMSDKNKLLNAMRGIDLRVVISGIAMITLAFLFWTGSRYPALTQKALMGGDTPLSGLSFDIILDVFPNSPIWWELVANMANWIMTNLKGMTFGVLFGAAMLTLLSVVKKKSFENGFANAALGAAIGAPLGVCVNCAAPIALGLHMGRMRLETTLSALIASPTLNVIVVTMSFALLPIHVAATKLLLSITMVLLIVPLLCRYWLTTETLASASNMAKLSKITKVRGLTGWIAKALAPRAYEKPTGGLLQSLSWYMRTFGRNLFFIAIITVPMMFLAAFLGALIATLVDSSALAYILPYKNALLIILAMVALAAVATFAPAPIALDIILTAVLLGIGLPTFYATVLVIALGTFSIYAFIILWRAISLKTAITIWVVTMGLAVGGGIIAKLTAGFENAYLEQRAEQYLRNAPEIIPPKPPSLSSASEFKDLQKQINAQKVATHLIPSVSTSDRGSTLSLTREENRQATSRTGQISGGTVFTRIPGQNLGLDERGVITPMRKIAPEVLVGGLAAGDIHGDGWIDIVTRRPTGATGLSIYANIGGRFVRQDMQLGQAMQSEVINLGFADLDNDSRLDLVVATKDNGVFIFYNQGGYFNEDDSVHLATERFGITTSLAFADMDGDSDIDIILGRWADGTGIEGWKQFVPDVSRNQIAWNDGDRRFSVANISGSAGQTLTTLVSDFNEDGHPDILKGDDVASTDQVVFFAGGRRTMAAGAKSQPFPYFMRTSMSYDVGDWNNDLRRDYYGAQIAEEGQAIREASMGDGRLFEICQQISRDNGWGRDEARSCATRLKSIDQIRGPKIVATNTSCNIAQPNMDTTVCLAMSFHQLLMKKLRDDRTISKEATVQKCLQVFAKFPSFISWCDAHLLSVDQRLTKNELARDHAPSLTNQNILMTRLADGTFSDEAHNQGVALPGWSWNSRFTDWNQDGWQDLLVMTGVWLSPSRATTNKFYHNRAGKFADATDAFGFHDLVPSYSYVSFDYDRDGDIDVVRDISASRMIVHRNDRPAGKALWVHLRDYKGNRMGVGATVIICTGNAKSVRPGKCQMRDIKASGGFQSFDPIAAHFGLGGGKVGLIQIRWPDGEQSDIRPETAIDGGEIVISRR
tara:strand:+ start:404 stop:3763 length:3360 start_codon:yes stop_codon:yes gene_type:complete